MSPAWLVGTFPSPICRCLRTSAWGGTAYSLPQPTELIVLSMACCCAIAEEKKLPTMNWQPSVTHCGPGMLNLGKTFARECRLEKGVDLKSPQRNECSWTALISQQVKCGQSRQALRMYEEMRTDGVEPSTRTFMALLKACSSLQDLESARRIHADVVRSGFGSNLYVSTMLVDVYAKCRSLVDARSTFENIPHRDVVSWTAMILGYAQLDQGEEALQLYTRMQQEGVVPDSRTHVGALKACSSLAESRDRNTAGGIPNRKRCLQTVKAIHVNVRKGNFESDVFVGNMLVDAYSKCGSLKDARQVFEEMPYRDVVSWSAIILGYAQMDMGAEALQLYSRMKLEGVTPDGWTYVGALKACSSLGEDETRNEKRTCLEIARSIHRDVRNGKSESNVFVGNILVDVYSKCGSLEDARWVFEKILRRDVVSWNAMILGYAQADKGEEALQLYARMQHEGVVPDARTYVSALKACCSLADAEEKHDRTDVKEKCLQTVRAIHATVLKAKFERNVFIETMLVDVYAKCGSLDDARHVFEKMPHHDVVSWTAMILGYAQVDNGEAALQLYTRMQQEGVVPDAQAYIGALMGCGSVAGLEKGKEIHAQIVEAGLEAIDSFLTDSLIDMYGKCGSMVDARQLFEAMPTKGTVAWNALIGGYAHQGDCEAVFDLFQRMEKEGVHPNGITFLLVLTVCSHVGLVDRGREYFLAMTRDYGITPTIEHFTCIIDLLGRAGHLDKAMEVVTTMPVPPNSTLWRCLLGACQKWGDVELGRHAFECAARLNEEDGAIYVLMSNIYAAAHMLEEAKEMQAMRVKSRAWKQPGESRWTDLGGISHVFVVGDQAHPACREIFAKLGDVLVKMEKEGYVPHLDSVLRDAPDYQEQALYGQSASLGTAYTLLKSQTP